MLKTIELFPARRDRIHAEYVEDFELPRVRQGDQAGTLGVGLLACLWWTDCLAVLKRAKMKHPITQKQLEMQANDC